MLSTTKLHICHQIFESVYKTVLILSDLVGRLGHEPQLLDLNQASFHKWLKIVTHDIGVQRKQNKPSSFKFMWRNLQGSIQQIRVHNYDMKLKETASTEYRTIRRSLGSYTGGIHNGKQQQQQLQLQLQGQAGQGVLRSSNWERITTMQWRNKFCAEEWNGI